MRDYKSNRDKTEDKHTEIELETHGLRNPLHRPVSKLTNMHKHMQTFTHM